jgi:dUTP pyrophosphatase
LIHPTVQFTRVREDEWFTEPKQSHPTDAGYDLTVSRDVIVHPSGFARVPTNVAIALPFHMWGLLVGRSSTFYNKFMLVNTGIIDSEYRGELQALIFNPTIKRVVARKGERLFQLILMPRLCNVAWSQADVLPPTVRGDKGFGSTGGFDPNSKDATPYK